MINYKSDILPIIYEASKIIETNTNSHLIINTKSNSNYVTNLDLQVEAYITTHIKQLFEDATFLSEESYCQNNQQSFWVLDPIDGTTNLIHNYPSSCISLAHIVDGTTIFGVVHCTNTHETFYAIRGKGAYLINNQQEEILISVNMINELQHSLVGFGFPYDKSKIPYLFKLLQPIIATCDDLKRKGPASLDICYVACGRLSAYLELDLEHWDYAAGALILTESGGLLTDFMGNSKIAGKSHIIASNGLVHAEIIDKLM